MMQLGNGANMDNQWMIRGALFYPVYLVDSGKIGDIGTQTVDSLSWKRNRSACA
jgi:hypothetical protein